MKVEVGNWANHRPWQFTEVQSAIKASYSLPHHSSLPNSFTYCTVVGKEVSRNVLNGNCFHALIYYLTMRCGRRRQNKCDFITLQNSKRFRSEWNRCCRCVKGLLTSAFFYWQTVVVKCIDSESEFQATNNQRLMEENIVTSEQIFRKLLITSRGLQRWKSHRRNKNDL